MRGPPGFRGRGPPMRMGHPRMGPPPPDWDGPPDGPHGFRPPPPFMRGGHGPRMGHHEGSPRGGHRGRGGWGGHRDSPPSHRGGGRGQPTNQIRTILTQGDSGGPVSLVGKRRTPGNLTMCEPPNKRPMMGSQFGPRGQGPPLRMAQHSEAPGWGARARQSEAPGWGARAQQGGPATPQWGGQRGPQQAEAPPQSGQCHSNLRSITLVDTRPPHHHSGGGQPPPPAQSAPSLPPL